METKYVVVNDNTLGYLIEGNTPGFEQVGILRGLYRKGATIESQADTMMFKSQCKTMRPATVADFNEYRVSVPPDFVGWQLEYNKQTT